MALVLTGSSHPVAHRVHCVFWHAILVRSATSRKTPVTAVMLGPGLYSLNSSVALAGVGGDIGVAALDQVACAAGA